MSENAVIHISEAELTLWGQAIAKKAVNEVFERLNVKEEEVPKLADDLKSMHKFFTIVDDMGEEFFKSAARWSGRILVTVFIVGVLAAVGKSNAFGLGEIHLSRGSQ